MPSFSAPRSQGSVFYDPRGGGSAFQIARYLYGNVLKKAPGLAALVLLGEGIYWLWTLNEEGEMELQAFGGGSSGGGGVSATFEVPPMWARDP